MNVSAQVYSVLSGSNAVTRYTRNIRPLLLEQSDSMPAVVYTIINTSPTRSLNGDCGLDAVTVQIDVWSKHYDTALGLAEAIRHVMGLKISLSPVPAMPEDYLRATFEDEHVTYENEGEKYRVIQEYTVWHSVGNRLFFNGESGGVFLPYSRRWQDGYTTPANDAGESVMVWSSYDGPNDAIAPGADFAPVLIR